jgi:branched-chain amino acid transport system ATP-binding protein
MKILEVNGLAVNYGMIKAVKGVDFYAEQGEIVSLIGSNGAGKSTIMNSIMGIVPISSGTVNWKGQNIAGTSTDKIVKSGIVLCPEGRLIFPELTVLQNLEIGAYTSGDEALVKRGIARAFEMFPRLEERKNQMGGTLSGGEQQMLAIGRALMTEPDLLMFDEPSLGLAPLIVKDIFSLIQRINEEMNTTILLVEQNAKQALKIADRGYVLETGTIVMTDTAENLLNSDAIKKAYLGGL